MTSDVQTQDVQTGCGQAGVTQTGIAQTGIAQSEIADAGAAALLGIGVVRVYQWTIRPFIGAHCRFWPSCSDYAVEALRVHGAAWGTALAAKRILRCNPWNEGGVDPVPGIDEDMGH